MDHAPAGGRALLWWLAALLTGLLTLLALLPKPRSTPRLLHPVTLLLPGSAALEEVWGAALLLAWALSVFGLLLPLAPASAPSVLAPPAALLGSLPAGFFAWGLALSYLLGTVTWLLVRRAQRRQAESEWTVPRS
ncbi:hypothetical protein ACFP81_07540 [Deinococcus lacus]|uniref:Uncharacterized protein n=1 Tax=Deinococcus lacus TaxID=392561 RepID=A0ABW1YC09_9DEIO